MGRWSVAGLLLVAMVVGCSGRPELIPNSDKSLRKSSAELAADAARRFPYPTLAVTGEAQARAQIGYALNRLEVVNLSDEVWTDVTIWVNGSYVVNLPTMTPRKLVSIPFQALFNETGQYFPLNNKRIEKVEILREGKVYSVPSQLAD